ncbi:DUF2334 domain-containing protein [Chloroflexota bacterium]
MREIALRIDDVGASSKIYNQYGKVYWELFGKSLPVAPFANWFFFKRIKPFKRWAIYRELTAMEWNNIFSLLRKYNAKLTVGITASWVEPDSSLIPFPKKFPEEASKLKEGVEEGLVEIAHHGLTHCVLKDDLYKPRWFSSNRAYHREFYEWLPEEVHKKHIFEAMDILTSYFKADIVTFVPPGNVWCEMTEKYAFQSSLKFLNSLETTSPTGRESNGLIYIGNNNVIDFHDKEIVEKKISWLEHRLLEVKEGNVAFCFVKEIGYGL